MSFFGKLVGGGLGFALGGPIGAIIGFALGAVLDDTKVVVQKSGVKRNTAESDFTASLLVLCAAVMKADDKVLKTELDYVKSFFVKHFGVDHTKEQMLLFREILKQDIPLYDVCNQIRHNMDAASRYQLIHFLFGLSKSDGHTSVKELDVIQTIAGYLGISVADFNSMKAMFYKDVDSDYKILEIDKNASDEEIKKAYRKMAVKFHPDKVSQLGEEIQKDAKEKFQRVQEAYEKIKKERGIA